MSGHVSEAHHYKLARGPATHGHHRVTFIELFFDLVFVFAITQLSHGLIAHPSLLGLFETAMLTMAVWWVWIYFAWSTNWADPDKTPVRLMMLIMMAAGLVMSMAIPKAFAEKAMPFALAYVFMQVGRTLFMLPVMREYSAAQHRNFLRILAWLTTSGVFWLLGAWLGGTALIGCWIVAIVIEYLGPAMRFYTPGLGHSRTTEWRIEPAHFGERCALFIIIALGESILVTGATFEKLAWDMPNSLAFASALAGTAAMWWIYFNIGQERGVLAMQGSDDPGRIARAYTYLHMPIVAGIIGTAVADEFVLAHATGHADAKTLAAVIGGPFLYVLGCGLFKRATAGWFPLSHYAGLALIAAVYFVAGHAQPWALSALTSLVLMIIAIWERLSLGADAVTKIGHPRERANAKKPD